VSVCGERNVISISPHVHCHATIRCRTWACETCGPELQRQLIARITYGQPNKFLTLTLDSSTGKTPEECHTVFVKQWPKLRAWWSKRTGVKKLPFFLVYEKHESGYPHAHICATADYVDQAEIADKWEELTGSRIVHIKAIHDPRHAARYVAKYMAEEPAQWGKSKRFYCSRNWPKKPMPKATSHYEIEPYWYKTAQTHQEFDAAHALGNWSNVVARSRITIWISPDYQRRAQGP
jgi:hypothetical protein